MLLVEGQLSSIRGEPRERDMRQNHPTQLAAQQLSTAAPTPAGKVFRLGRKGARRKGGNRSPEINGDSHVP